MNNLLTKDEVEMAKTEGINDLALLDAAKKAYITLNSKCDLKDEAKQILAKAIEMEEKRLNWDTTVSRDYPHKISWHLTDAAKKAMKHEALKEGREKFHAEEVPAPTMSAPWYTYVRKLKALFEADPEVRIFFYEDDNTVELTTDTVEKAEAIRMLLPPEVHFGNVLVKVHVILPPQPDPDITSIIKAAFKGNPNFVDCLTIKPEGTSNPFTFVIFENKVVQIWNDDISDANGLYSTLLEALASQVLALPDGVYCNTAPGKDIIR